MLIRTVQELYDLVHKIEIKKCSGPSVVDNFRQGLEFCRKLPEWKELVSGEYHAALTEVNARTDSMNNTAAEFYRAALSESSKNIGDLQSG